MIRIRRFNTEEWIKNKTNVTCNWIKFDKEINPEYDLYFEGVHENSFEGLSWVINSLIEKLINMETYYKNTYPGDNVPIEEIHYTVGEIKALSELSPESNCQRSKVSIPVKCEYILG